MDIITESILKMFLIKLKKGVTSKMEATLNCANLMNDTFYHN